MKNDLKKLSEMLKKMGHPKQSKFLNELIKTSGQIPAGMHRFILQRGLVGGSEYDSLEYSDDESTEDNQEEKESEQP